MKPIYEPKGKAKEYCDLAVNLYKGCGHGCTYCYAPAILRKSGLSKDDFYNHPSVRPGILEALTKDAPKYKGREVQLCFTCDPYQPIEQELQVTREAIKILKSNEIIVRILTKGGILSTRDFDLLEPGVDWYGATLSFLDAEKSETWEPGAASPENRITALTMAKSAGLNTWASMEPVIDPGESFRVMMECIDAVDVFKIGAWNYDSRAKEINWREFVTNIVMIFELYGKEYYIKKDLKDYLG